MKATVTSETNPSFAAKVQAAMDANPELAEEMKPKKKPVEITEFLRYEFTEDEIKEKGAALARSVQQQQLAQEEQKAAAAQFKERIERYNSEIGRYSREVSNGYEMRNIKCRVTFHTPTEGTKRIVRLDTGELVREMAMDGRELQDELFEVQ